MKPVQFRPVQIKTEQFALFQEHFSTEKEITYTSGVHFRCSSEHRIISVFFGFQFLSENQLMVLLDISCHFEIEPGSWTDLLKGKKKQVILPRDFALHIATITVGTARGILHARTEGTNFNGMVLPPINLTEIITADVTPE